MARTKEFDREERLTKARDLFWRKGYHATSMQDIVSTMGLNPGSIYNTFGDKHELFLQCLRNYAGFKLSQYVEAREGFASPLKAIENIILMAVKHTLEEERACMAVNSTFELAPVDKSVRTIIADYSKEIQGIFRELLELAVQKKELKRDTEPELMAAFISSSFSGFWQTYVITRDKSLVEKLAHVLIEVIKK